MHMFRMCLQMRNNNNYWKWNSLQVFCIIFVTVLFNTILLVIVCFICQLMKIPFKSPTVITDFFNNSCYFTNANFYVYRLCFKYSIFKMHVLHIFKIYILNQICYIDFLSMKCFTLKWFTDSNMDRSDSFALKCTLYVLALVMGREAIFFPKETKDALGKVLWSGRLNSNY